MMTILVSAGAMLVGMALFSAAMAVRARRRPSGCCGAHAVSAKPHVHGGDGCSCTGDGCDASGS